MAEILDRLGLMKGKKGVSYQQILNNLMDSSHNLPMKSRIPKPLNLAVLTMVGKYYNKRYLPDSSLMVKGFVEIILEYFVSEKGKGREEIIKALAHLMDEEKRELDKGNQIAQVV